MTMALLYCGTPKASTSGHPNTVTQLINANANLEATNKDGRTPLIFASLYGHNNVVPVLIRVRINVWSLGGAHHAAVYSTLVAGFR